MDEIWKCPDCGGEVCGTRLVRHYYALNKNGGNINEYTGEEDEVQEEYACRECGREWSEWEDLLAEVFGTQTDDQ